MNNPNKTGLNDLAVLVSRRTFGANRVSHLAKNVKKGSFKFSIKNIQLWVVSVLTICSVLSLMLAWNDEPSVKYRSVANLICVFIAYVGSFAAFSYIRQRVNQKTKDLVNIGTNPIQVIRGGQQVVVPLSDIVVNDIVVLEEGGFVPADGILLRTAGIRVDESNVGGNSDVQKRVGSLPSKSSVYPSDWMIGGSVVIEGNGVMKVTRVGEQTEFGKSTAVETSNVDSRVPYVYLVDVVSRKVALYVMLYSLLISIVCYFAGSVSTLYDILIIPINFIVSSLPIIVPYAVAIITYLANKRIAKMGVKVKNMNTPYALGMTSSIISGRFGMISDGLMKVTNVFVGCSREKDEWLPVGSSSFIPQNILSLFYKHLSLSTTASIKDADNINKRHVSGAAEESAIVNWLYGNHIDVHRIRREYVVVDRVLSMRESGLCAVLVEDNDENYVFVQGKPKEVFSLCRYVQSEDGRIEIDEYVRLLYKAAKSESPYMISVAYARVPSSIKSIGSIEALDTVRMTLLGLIYIDDSLRKGVKEFVSTARSLNIDVRMITSLRKESAAFLAAKSDILNDYEASHTQGEDSVCLTSQEIKQRYNGRLPYEVIKRMKVISQVTLSDRMDIVNELQQNGEIVSMVSAESRLEQLDDLADIAITLRQEGSDIHRPNEVSINKDHLSTLSNAIVLGKMLIRNEGRVYSVMMGLSFALVALNTVSILTCGTPLVSIIQMFWLDLVCVGLSALAIVLITNDRSLKRANIHTYNNFTRNSDFFRLAIIYAVFHFVLVSAFWMLSAKMDIVRVSDIWNEELQWGIPTNPTEDISVYERTLIMTLIVMSSFWSLIIVRIFNSSESIFFRMKNNWSFYLMSLMIPLTHFLIVYYKGDLVMAKTETAMDWVYMMAISSTMLIYVEIRQFVRRHYLSRKPK